MALLQLLLFISTGAQPRNILLEYCAGTWCSYCTNATDVINNSILQYYPNTVILAYHGWQGSIDPFADFPGNEILDSLHFNNYPTGRIDRTGDALPEYSWLESIDKRIHEDTNVRMDIEKTTDISERKIDVTIDCEALKEFKEEIRITIVLVEDNITALQYISEDPGVDSNYVHNNVVRSVISNIMGDELNGSNIWQKNEVLEKIYTISIPVEFVLTNCRLVVFVHYFSDKLYEAEVLQAESVVILDSPLSVFDFKSSKEYFILKQNLPNPFNSLTIIKYSVPVKMIVKLEVLNVTGEKIRTLVHRLQDEGTYEVNFNAGSLTSGIYIYRLVGFNNNEKYSSAKKMLLVK